jgi:hypothetical protein
VIERIVVPADKENKTPGRPLCMHYAQSQALQPLNGSSISLCQLHLGGGGSSSSSSRASRRVRDDMPVQMLMH